MNKKNYNKLYRDAAKPLIRFGDSESKVKLMTVVNDVIKEFEKVHIHYWLAGGTLLGGNFTVKIEYHSFK
jgi:hypothetical protein